MAAEPRTVDELIGTEPEAVEPGVYIATLDRIELADTTYGERLRWHFVIPSADDHEVSGWTSPKITPKSKAGDWVEVITGRRLTKGERLPVADMTGRSVGIVLTVDEESGYNRLKDLTPATQPKPADEEEAAAWAAFQTQRQAPSDVASA